MKLSTKILAIGGGTAVICVGVVAVLLYSSIKTTLQDQTSASQVETTKQAMDKVGNLMYERQIDVQSITQQTQIRTLLSSHSAAAAAVVNDNLSAYRDFAPAWESLSVLDPGGTALASTDQTTIGHNHLSSGSTLAGLAAQTQTNQVVSSDLFLDAATNQPTLVYLAPIKTGDTVVGLVEGRLAWSQVVAVLHTIHGPTAYLLNRDGLVLASNSAGPTGLSSSILKLDYGHTAAFSHARDHAAGSAVITAPDDPAKPAVVSFSPEPSLANWTSHGWYLILDTPTSIAFASATHLTLMLQGILSGIVVLGITIVLFLLNRQVLQPINRMGSAMSRVTLGDLTQTVPTGSQDEFDALGHSFNEMIRQLASTHRNLEATSRKAKDGRAQLEASINSLRQGFILTDAKGQPIMLNAAADTMMRITPGLAKDADAKKLLLKSITNDLPPDLNLTEQVEGVIRTRKAAKFPVVPLAGHYLNIYLSPVVTDNQPIGCVLLLEDVTEERIIQRSRDEFFSIASHELRTPLTAIRGNTALIQQYYAEALKDKNLRDMVSDIHESSVRLIEIVNDFLDASRLEQDKMKLTPTAFAIEPLIETVVYEMAGVSRDKGVTLKFDHNLASLPRVYADSNRVKQVIYNLIGNAMKFTEAGSVTIGAEIHGHSLKVLVSDTGLGISTEGQQLLFHKFQQTGSSLITRDTTRGTGLGLYISKLLIEHMDGKIKLEHSELGKGTTFSFTLPLATKAQTGE